MPVAIELIGDETRRDRNRDPQVDVTPSPRPAGGAPAPPRYGRAPQDLLPLRALFILEYCFIWIFAGWLCLLTALALFAHFGSEFSTWAIALRVLAQEQARLAGPIAAADGFGVIGGGWDGGG
jgi:hypothetical protein